MGRFESVSTLPPAPSFREVDIVDNSANSAHDDFGSNKSIWECESLKRTWMEIKEHWGSTLEHMRVREGGQKHSGECWCCGQEGECEWKNVIHGWWCMVGGSSGVKHECCLFTIKNTYTH